MDFDCPEHRAIFAWLARGSALSSWLHSRDCGHTPARHSTLSRLASHSSWLGASRTCVIHRISRWYYDLAVVISALYPLLARNPSKYSAQRRHRAVSFWSQLAFHTTA